MSLRQVVLDTETTGISVEDKHRIIEIGCVELIDRKLTGREFHTYINPERESDAAAFAVHGIKNDFLQTQPLFKTIANDFIDFIKDAELIIHNAPFDIAFLNFELTLSKSSWKTINEYCQIIDTLVLARQLHVGQRNNLDALCKRYGIDNTKRDLHGALLDANLLAQVYLAMTGGQGSFFDSLTDVLHVKINKENNQSRASTQEQFHIKVIKATDCEIQAHQKYLETIQQNGKCLWLEDPS